MRTLLFLTTLLISMVPAVSTADAGYQETVLPNGMMVVTREDHSVSLVAVMVMIRAGSVDETAAASGVSHLLEHLVFDGTPNLSREKIKERFDSSGGYVNAYTREEHVGHEIVMPREFIQEGIQLQANMLLRSTIPERELAKEKNVVIEEIRASKSQPQSVAADLFQERLYAQTPYARPVLGTEESVRAMSRKQIFDYYRKSYHPANMTAFVVGDITHAEAVQFIRSAYAQGGPDKLAARPTIRPNLSGEKLIVKARIPTAYLEAAVAAPHPSSPDAGPFQLLVQVLGGGDDSRLYRRLVQTDKPTARYVTASYEPHHDHALLRISILLSDADLANQALGTVMDEIARLASEPIPEPEFERARTGYRAGEVFGSERLLHLARELASWQSAGDYRYKERLQRQVAEATRAQTRAVAQQYFSKPKYLAALIGPEGKVGNLQLEIAQAAPQASGSAPLQPPPPKPGEPAKGNRTIRSVLPNGLVIVARENPYAEIVSMNILVKNRSALEPEGLSGVGHFDSMMLDEGTNTRTAEQISELLAATGARLQLVDNPFLGFDDYYLSKNYSYIRLESLSEFFESDLAVAADMVRNPSYPQDRMEAIRREILARFKEAESSSYFQARKAFFESLFPEHHYRTSIIGTPTAVEKMAREDLFSYHRTAYAPNNLIVTVVGNRPAQVMIDLIARAFGSMARVDLPCMQIAQPQSLREPVVLMKNVKSEQAAIYHGNALPVMDFSRLPAIEMMNEILTARLNSKVREKLGLAYSVGSETELSPLGGWFYVAMGTRAENVAKAKDAILRELIRLRDELVPEYELRTARSSIWGRRLRYRQSRINQAYFLGYAEYLGLGYQFDDRFIGKLAEVTPDDIRRTAREVIHLPAYTLSVAGE